MRSGQGVPRWVFSAVLGAAFAACSSEPSPQAPEGGDHLEFQGVPKSREPELRELLAPDLKRYLADPRDTILDDAVFRLKYHYRFAGYPDVQVEYERTPSKVIFKIREGPEVTLGRVHFIGNTVFTDDELKAARPRGFLGEAVPFSDRLITALRDQILAEYGKKGYIEAEVGLEEHRTPEDPDRVQVTFVIKEGRKFTIAGIDGQPDDPELQWKLGKFLQEPYTPGTSETVEAAVIDYLRDHGYPFGQAIAVAKVNRDDASVRLQLDVKAGPKTKIGTLHVSGNNRTRDSFVRQRADLDEGETYHAEDLRRAEERLRETRLFRSARVTPGNLEEGQDRVAIDVTVEEKEFGEASIRGGYGTLDGPRGGLDLSYMNLLGGAELVRISGTVSYLGYRGDAEMALPYFLGTEFRPGGTGWFERHQFPDFDSTSFGTLGTLQYSFTEKTSLQVGARYAIIRTDHVNPAVPPGDLLDFAYTALLASGAIDLLDNTRLPTQGLYAAAEVDWSPEGFRSDIVFVSASGHVSGYVPLPLDLVLATSFQGGIIVPRGKTEEIPISLRYFTGGETSVRGFKTDRVGSEIDGEPTGGEVYMALQSELRFPILGDFHGAVFSDQGGTWFDHNHVAINELRWSVGIGIRYYTPAGAFVVDGALNPRRQKGESSGAVAFSIGFPF